MATVRMLSRGNRYPTSSFVVPPSPFPHRNAACFSPICRPRSFSVALCNPRISRPQFTSPCKAQTSRGYYTSERPQVALYPPAETAILSAALEHVPTHGFNQQSLAMGAADAGYLPASVNLFPRGAFDLLLYYLVTQRLRLKDIVRFPTPLSQSQSNPATPLGTGAKVRALILARIHANQPVIHHYTEAIALMSLAGNIPASAAELARLADEIWYLAGDVSVDSRWYTKRGLLAGVYASAEVFMTQDQSKGYIETQKFVDRRLDDVRRFGGAVGAVNEWVGYTAMSAVNVARSLGVRI